MIRIAIQAKGRLNEDTAQLLAEAGIDVEQSKRKLLTYSREFPLEVLYLRDDDIPHAVAAGVADIGIVGLNEIEEKGQDVRIMQHLGFGKCRLSLAIPKNEEYDGPQWFEGRRVATSYPRILAAYFEKLNVRAEIHEIAGSVEIAPSVGMADAIFDIVSSGGTLVANGLTEVEQVLQSEAALIANPTLTAEKITLMERLMFRFKAVESSRGMKYVLMNIPQERVPEAVKILPGMKSPTLLPLAEKGWCSIHTVLREAQLWEKVGELKAIGARDILVLAVEKLIQ